MRVLKLVASVCVALVVALGAAFVLVPTDRLAALATQQFERATGRSLRIGGEVSTSFYPVLGARARDIGLDLPSLLRGRIAVDRMVLQSPVLTLRRAADGRASWDMSGSGGADGGDGNGGGPTLTLAEARIADGTLRYTDAATGQSLALDGIDATLRMPGPEAPLSLQVTAQLNGQRAALNMTADRAGALLAGDRVALQATARLAGAEAGFDGHARLGTLEFDGAVDGRLPALAPVLAALGQGAATLPAPLRPLSVRGQATRTADGRLQLRDAALSAGTIDAQGRVDVALDGPRPRLDAQFSAGTVDLRGLGGDTGGAGGAPPPDGWSRAPINAAALGAVDGQIALSVDRLRTDMGTIAPLDLRTTIDTARAVTEVARAGVFDGSVTGQLVANNRSGFSASADLRASGIALRPLLSELAGVDRLQGTADARVDVLGAGGSLHALMNSLRGDGSVDFAQGEIIGLDLAGMLRNLDMSYMGDGARTIYEAISASFTISGGVLRNDDLRLSSPRVTVTGNGTVGLGARTLDYRIVPAALGGDGGDGLRVPLMVTGPWDAPRLRLDMEALAEQRLRAEQEQLEQMAREEAARLEQRARDEAESRVTDELGVTREDGESLEDTVRRGVEERLGDGLRGLLGGN